MLAARIGTARSQPGDFTEGGGQGSVGARFELERPSLVIDEPAAFRLVGLRPGEVVRIVAVGEPWTGQPGRSEATFRADENGVVDPRVHESIAGTYLGVDPNGMWWSVDGPDYRDPWDGDEYRIEPIEYEWELTAFGESEIARATVVRRRQAEDVVAERIDDEGFTALYARPRGGGPFPAVVVLGGSDGRLGGFADPIARLLASHGFAALGVAYFGETGRPPGLVNIPLEYLIDAANWLERRAEAGRVGVLGYSFGGAIALLLASYCERIAAVAALCGGSRPPPSIGPGAGPDVPSFTYRGKPLGLRHDTTSARHSTSVPRSRSTRPTPDKPFRLADTYGIGPPTDPPEPPEIPVERIQGPVLVQWAGDDGYGVPTEYRRSPTARNSVVEYLRDQEFPHAVEFLYYPDAGHGCVGPPTGPMFTSAYHPVTRTLYDLGGTREANIAARADSWPRILAFFDSALR